MDALAALRLQIEWGADEALGSVPLDRFQAGPMPLLPAVASPVPVAVATAMRPTIVAGIAQTDRVRAARDLARDATTLESLETAMRGFAGCALALTATSLVFGAGAADARLMIVGDVPGAAEDRSGIPLDGPAGALLARMLASVDLDLANLRRAAIVPWRPPGGRPASDAEVAVCLPFLHRHIALARPAALLLLGALAARTLLATDAAISRMRGRWAKVSVEGMAAPVPALPLLHPAQLIARPDSKAAAWGDLRMLRRTLDANFTNI